jgi:tetraacyldisaccharide-1-P 4'-kinase
VLAVAAIGEPDAFREQLEALGARVQLSAFRDHHRFTDAEVRSLALAAPADGLVVCTLKDAVKLGGRWPGPSRLWYVSQQLVVDQGAEHLDRLMSRALNARAAATTAG